MVDKKINQFIFYLFAKATMDLSLLSVLRASFMSPRNSAGILIGNLNPLSSSCAYAKTKVRYAVFIGLKMKKVGKNPKTIAGSIIIKMFQLTP